MITVLFVAGIKVVAFVAAALVVGGILAYAFRGKEHALISEVGSKVKSGVSDIEKHL